MFVLDGGARNVVTHFGDNIGNQKTVEGNAFEVAHKVRRVFCFFGDKIDL
jgi:hypothetical protein